MNAPAMVRHGAVGSGYSVDLDLRAAEPDHVVEIHSLISREAARGRMLPRTLLELRQRINEFRVVTGADGKVLAAGGLRPYDARAAEIIGLTVGREARGQGLGARLVQSLVREAWSGGMTRVFALTLEPRFFEGLGFLRGSIDQVPEKVAADCAGCPLRSVCREVTMILDHWVSVEA